MAELNTREVARIYGKSQSQVVYAFAQGYVPEAKKVGGSIWIIREEDLPMEWPIKRRGPRMKRG